MRSSLVDDDQVIDLKELFLYVCRKWRVLIALVVLGVVLGAGFGAYKSATETKNQEQTAVTEGKPNLEYDLYLRLYRGEQKRIEESVYLNLEADQIYSANVRYLMKVKAQERLAVSELYNAILDGTEICDELIAAGELICTPQAVRELITIDATITTDEEDHASILAIEPMQVFLAVAAPSREACVAMLDVLDGRAQEICQYVADTYGATLVERLVSPCEKSVWDSKLAQAKRQAVENLNGYKTKLTSIEKTLTEEEKAYYSPSNPSKSEKDEKTTWVKWALIVGVVFGMLGAGWYAVIYLLDGHVKNEDELLAYGLHPFAVVKGSEERKKPNALDRLLMPKYRYQSDDYLAEALDVLDAESIVICGDLGDADIANHAQSVAETSQKLLVAPQMVESAKTQAKAKQADGVVLFVHLWKTKRADLEQEIRICQKIGARVLGVAIIG